ncbi:MAG TPA: hypothetical protein VM095_06200 [Pyrinomonadaceae bacterium]|nr:hypothetical protein [Pyrinomonadaceae bacterium]
MFAPTGLRSKAFILTLVLAAGLSSTVFAQQKKTAAPLPAGKPVTWRDPGDISARDLRFGPGSAELAPLAPFTFVEEIKTGVSPKFKVKDARGVSWSVKMGEEAQAETVATRLVWAMGYFADEAYYFDRVEVPNLPRLSRGQEFVQGKIVRGVRFEPKRKEVRRGATWDWLQNPFLNTREFNGLKVMMVLLANYDTRLDNNQIYTVKHPETGEWEARYIVADIGATFGKVGGLGGKRVKNSLEDFRASKFVVNVENGMVNFDYSTKPKGAGGAFASLFGGGYAKRQANKEKAMKSVPVEHARWIGDMLSRLSDEQLRDAFRAANYDNATMEGFITALRGRINQLTQLPAATPVATGQNPGR